MSAAPSSGANARLVLVLSVIEILGMAGFATFAALLPTFLDEWRMSNTEGGWISGIFYAGYVAAVPFLVAFTDRIDPRRIYIGSTVLSGLSALAFALLAEGFWSALALRALAGVGLAGTYMPGLKLLTDHVEGPAQPRAVAFYTSGFGIGTSLSFLLSGEIGTRFGWQWAFGAAAIGSFAGLLLTLLLVPPTPPRKPERPLGHPLDFRPVLRNRGAMAYILAYMAHNWELFGFRSWLVAFLVFSQSLQAPDSLMPSPPVVATIVVLIGMPASIFGGEIAMRIGRRRLLISIMSLSAGTACVFGFTAALPFAVVVLLCLVYGALITADSASLTAGMIAASDRGQRGAAMAVHSCIGFVGAFLGPLAFGVVLDLLGGSGRVTAWGAAFAAMGLGCALGPLILARWAARP